MHFRRPRNGYTRGDMKIEIRSMRVSPKTVWSFVRVDDDRGAQGWGEATVEAQAPAVHAAVEALARSCAQHSCAAALDDPHAWARQRLSACANLPQAAALSAIEQALWDLRARSRRETLAAALASAGHGAVLRESVGVYANINRGTVDRSPAGFEARARLAASEGFGAVKIAPLDGVTPDNVASAQGREAIAIAIERIAATRSGLGKGRALMVDCHWRLNEQSASALIEAIAPLGVSWFECPLSEDESQYDAIRRLRTRANEAAMVLAGGETMVGVEGFRPILEAGLYDVIMPDVKYVGGLAELLAVARLAAEFGVDCSPHNPSGPVCHAHSIAVSTLVERFPILEMQFAESELFYPATPGLAPPESGACKPNQSIGLGVAPDAELLSAHCWLP